MMPNKPLIHYGEQCFSLTLKEITYSLEITKEVVLEILDEGIINAQKDPVEEWIFDHEAFKRMRTMIILHRDLGVNFAGAALALELLEEIHRLKKQ